MSTFDIIEDTETTLAAPGNEINAWTVDDIRKSDILVFRESQSQYVDSVIAPNGFQVGLIDENFLTDLLVTGHITGSGIIYSELGFSGSLQTLVDGSDYLVGEGGISITNNEDGSITISGGGAGGVAGSRIKTVYNLASTGAFPTAGLFFADYDYSSHLIDVYHNGELLTSGAAGDSSADFYLGTDTVTGGVINFNFDTTTADDVTVIVGSLGSGGGGGGGTTYNAGVGLSLGGSTFNVNTDGVTTTTNESDQLEVLRTPGEISAGNGLQGTSFNGSVSSIFSVRPVAGSPVTVSSAGVGMDISSLQGLPLENTDELLIQQGSTFGKVSVGDLITAAGGTPGVTDAAYLVAQTSSSLTNERVLTGGAGISVTDSANTSSFTVSAVVNSGGGVRIVNGGLAVRVADFIGFGLSDSSGTIVVDPASFAGDGLSVVGGRLTVDFGPGANQAAEGTNTITVNPGDGLNLGGTVSIGASSSTINLAVQSEDIAGTGLSVTNNDLKTYLLGTNGITISEGAADSNGFTPLIIDGSNIQTDADITAVIAGPGLQGGADSGDATVQVDYDDTSNVIMDAYDGTSITVDEENDRLMLYDESDQQVKYIKPSQIAGSGGSATAGVIGNAEDGTYTDGLFTDFNPDTPTGTAIDRFNEILKALAPPPAPELTTIDEDVTNGTTAFLSFGASNNTPYEDVVAIGEESAKDVNDEYAYSADGNDIVLGIYDGTQLMQGTLNDQVLANLTSPSNLTNYSADAFKDADVGSLILEVNGVDVETIDLSSFVSGNSLTNNTGFWNVSEATSGQFDSGVTFGTFKHRTANWRVDPQAQVDGFNYVRVKHSRSASDISATNYVLWVNDSDTSVVSATNTSAIFTGSNVTELSGVRYFGDGQIQYTADVNNLYRFVYDLSPLSISSTSSGVLSNLSYSPTNVQRTTIGPTEDHTKVVQVNKTTAVSADYILGGSVTTRLSATHPLKASTNNIGSESVDEILMWGINASSTPLLEPFDDENYRLQSGAYDAQGDIAGGTWDSSVHMDAGTYADGLQLYQRVLKSPLDTLNGGDFSALQNGPSGNPDYSGVTGTRTYYRRFQNNEGSVHDFSYIINSSGVQVPQSTAFTTSNFKVSFKLPSNGTDDSGWLDAASIFSYQNTGDGDGGYIGNFNGASGQTRYLTLGTGSINNGDYIVMKLEADASWTGNIDSISVDFGATGTVAASSDLETININESPDSTSAKLSFGDTLTLANYSTVETTAGNTERNANDIYASDTTRVGVIGPTLRTITGTLNFDQTASGNSYPADAFGGLNGNKGDLKLYLNGALLHSVDLSSFSSGPSLTGGSGFDLTAPLVGRDSNNLPNYDYWYRTGTYTVSSTAQREGWNYIRVIHTVDGVDYETNYQEWVNDSSNPSLASNDVAIDGITDTNISWLSGVQYFESPEGNFKFRASNVYKYVYSSGNAISFPTTTNTTITSIEARNDVNTLNTNGPNSELPSLDINTVSAYDTDLFVTGSFSFDRSSSIPGKTSYSATISGRVTHPLVSNLEVPSTTLGPFLVNTVSDNSTATSESFSGEDWRLQDVTFPNQASISSNAWDSQQSLVGANVSHNTGLIVYGDELRYPSQAGLGADLGDFRDTSETGPLIAPIGNPDYSGATGLRTYIRKFQNTSGQSQSNFDVTITGSGDISTVTNPSGNEIKMYIKLPDTTDGFTTGFLDIGVPFATNQYSDGDGCLLGQLDNTLNATNRATLGVNSVGDDEYIIIKIVAPATWSGYVSGISVSWG